MLVLDEPTRSLDAKSTDGLVYGLVKIVKGRHLDKLQLIVFTHNEGFVRTLVESKVAGSYW